MTTKKKESIERPKRRRRRKGGPYLVVVEHRIRFRTESPVSVEAVIASLRGMDRIVKTQLPKAIEAVTGARVKRAELQVSGLEDGSFVEDLTIKLFFKTKEDYEQCVDKIADTIKSTWEGGTPMLKVAIGVLIGALVIGSLNLLPNDAPTGSLSTIQGDNNAVIIIGAEAYQTSPEEFQKAIDTAISKTSQKRAVQSALDTTAPSREQGAALEFEGETGAVQVLSKEGASVLPKTVDVQDTSEEASYSKVKLKLRASDYDSAVKGWAGTIPGVVDVRTRVMFANDVEAGKAAFRPEVEADVLVTYTSPLHQRAILILVERVH